MEEVFKFLKKCGVFYLATFCSFTEEPRIVEF